MTILGVNAHKLRELQVHKIVKGGNHAEWRRQKSAISNGALCERLPSVAIAHTSQLLSGTETETGTTTGTGTGTISRFQV